jgi:molybdopterin/thiamine biosynthesis adenylyltransferase
MDRFRTDLAPEESSCDLPPVEAIQVIIERKVQVSILPENVRPRLKRIYPIYRLDGTTFRIGAQLGITIELDDPEHHVWTLVHLLNGMRTVPEIVVAMLERFPMINERDVHEAIVALDQQGLLEDAWRAETSDGPGGESLERWTGNINYFSHYARLAEGTLSPHARLRRSKVVLLGLGGGGSTILPILAATGVGCIVAVDYDRVERSNLNRQFLYRESDLGHYKTDAAERVMAEVNSDVDFSAVTARIDAAEDAVPIVRGADLVICAIDEPPFLAQRRVNRACVEEGVTCLYGFSQVTRGRVFSVVPRRSGCVDCLNIHYSQKDPLFVSQFAGFHSANFIAPTIAYAPDIVRLAGLIVAEAVRLLTNYAPPKSIATQFEFDFEADTAYSLLDWPRFETECPTCGSGCEERWPIFAAYPGRVSRADQVTDVGAA